MTVDGESLDNVVGYCLAHSEEVSGRRGYDRLDPCAGRTGRDARVTNGTVQHRAFEREVEILTNVQA